LELVLKVGSKENINTKFTSKIKIGINIEDKEEINFEVDTND